MDIGSVSSLDSNSVVVADLPALLHRTTDAARALLSDATAAVRGRVSKDGRIDRKLADQLEQHAVHGLAWWATYVAIFEQSTAWIDALTAENMLGESDALLAQLLVTEYAFQFIGGLPMNQGEIIRPAQLGVSQAQVHARFNETLLADLNAAGSQKVKTRIAELLQQGRGRATLENTNLGELYDAVRDQFFNFSAEHITPFAHGWHVSNELIPLSVIEKLSELGVFGLTIDEAYGGAGMSKIAMCVVSEELSRGYIGVGSLPTRSEIAAELILRGGTQAQKEEWLPKLASGHTLPTAVFTEPNSGSDLGSLRTRAVLKDDTYYVSGGKTWITHASRADLMTLLVRTDSSNSDYRGLSMLLAPKHRADENDAFQDEGLTGGEIHVIGYRGMREYELGFDEFKVPAANLLGGVEGQGFKQLMATFESARIQTAARAIGVAQSALDAGLTYASDRKQFKETLASFPRVQNKLAMIAAEIAGVRQLTYFAARQKDEDKRCDVEAGMAKLVAARVAWAAADNVLQIHGGNGFAVEFPISRILADARILNIFEGAGEIQAQVIGRRLFEDHN